jgi:hypothetical protein
MTPLREKQLLQCCVAIACIVPVIGGISGVMEGAAFLGGGNAAMDSHFRYLSGLLLGIGIAFLSGIPNIEMRSMRFRMLTFIILTGGFARLLGFLVMGNPGHSMSFALVMELIVTPALCLWQHRIAGRFNAN